MGRRHLDMRAVFVAAERSAQWCRTGGTPVRVARCRLTKGGSGMALNWPLLRQGQPAPGPLAVEPIRSLQYLLRQHGHPEVVVDGIFGPITEAAVRAFQQSRGLLVDGIVRNQT